MNLFRSEEHARADDKFDPSMERMVKPLGEWARIFSNPFFRERGRSDYISWTKSDEGHAAMANLRADLA